MAFRSSDTSQRNELVRYQLDDAIRAPVNGQHQDKNGCKFTINDGSAFYDWYNAYFEIQFQVQKLADGTAYGGDDRITVISGSHSFINHLMIKSSGKIVYDTDNLHLDTDSRIANANQSAGFEARRTLIVGYADVNVIIPLNRYSFFEELEDKMLIPMQLQFNITLQNDNELLQKADAADDGRVVLDRFLLWVPRLTPKDSLYDNFVSSFFERNKMVLS